MVRSIEATIKIDGQVVLDKEIKLEAISMPEYPGIKIVSG